MFRTMGKSDISRRDFLRRSLSIAAGALLLPTIFDEEGVKAAMATAQGEVLGGVNAKAKSIIFIFLNGGPSHIDTFDPKPDSSREIFGNFKTPIATNNPDLMINEKLTNLAQIADRYSIIRSMSHNSNAHEIGQYVIFSGDMSLGSIVYPSFGATISYMLRDRYKGILPPFITIPQAATRFNESGFLSAEYKSFSTGGAPESALFEVEGIVSKGVSVDQLSAKRDILSKVAELSDVNIEQSSEVERFKKFQDDNYSMILGKEREIFDLSKESKETRERYGMNRLGQSCLAARRLVEGGTPVIVVNATGWDTHKEHFKRMNTKLPEMDQAVATLILDLEERGLLDETIVLLGGEFGRTPRVDWQPPWNGGRGHFGSAFSFLVAGGGFKGGQVLGKTNETGERVVERVVYPNDLWATIYQLMGIDPKGTLPHPQEGRVPIIPPLPTTREPSKGILTELIKA